MEKIRKNKYRFVVGIVIIALFVGAYVLGYKTAKGFKGGFVQNDSTEANASNEQVIKKSTKYVLETVNDSEGKKISEELPVPTEFLGNNREKLISFIENNNAFFEDEEHSVKNVMLLSFSDKEIAIRRNVVNVEKETETMDFSFLENEPKYFIVLFEDRIVVYKEDKTTVYMDTGISKDELDEEEISELKNGIAAKNISELYRLLESFTS